MPYERQGQKLEDFPRLKGWFEAIHGRPAVIRGLDVGKDKRAQTMSEEAKKVLFGQTAANVLSR
jgi:GST-like protein